jgi:hypothetical protein
MPHEEELTSECQMIQKGHPFLTHRLVKQQWIFRLILCLKQTEA